MAARRPEQAKKISGPERIIGEFGRAPVRVA
jgi:hypothetical protein